MELSAEIIREILSKSEARISFPDLEKDIQSLAKERCCQALSEIKAILEEDRLSDGECFTAIEKIVRVLSSWAAAAPDAATFEQPAGVGQIRNLLRWIPLFTRPGLCYDRAKLTAVRTVVTGK